MPKFSHSINYLAQSNLPWLDSWIKPANKITRKITSVIPTAVGLNENILSTTGKISKSSTSKIRKITAIRKNRNEKGRRDTVLGSNPHSKGLDFSRSCRDLEDRAKPKLVNSPPKTPTNVKTIINLMIWTFQW